MTRKLFLNLCLLLAICLFNSGCAVNRATATLDPTTDLSNIKSLHVVKLDLDDWGLNQLIANKLRKMEYFVSTGVDTPIDVDAVVTYKDEWMWDITTYMLELTITIRDPTNDFPLASGNSYHTSLSRLSPEEMVDEVINNIFKQKGENGQ